MSLEPQTHTLIHPITLAPAEEGGADIVITKVTLSMVKGRGLRAIGRIFDKVYDEKVEYGEIDATMDCIQLMSDSPDGMIEEAEAVDINAMGSILAPFLEAAMPSEETSPNSQGGTATTQTK